MARPSSFAKARGGEDCTTGAKLTGDRLEKAGLIYPSSSFVLQLCKAIIVWPVQSLMKNSTFQGRDCVL